MTLLRLLSTYAVLAVVLAAPLCAQTTNSDIQVATRAVKFMEAAPSGAGKAFILFDPGNSASAADADAIAGYLGSGVKAGSANLAPEKVAIGDLTTVTGNGIVIVTNGMSAHFGAIGSHLAGSSILSVSSDFACVEASSCAVGVASKPKVRIVISQAGASQAGVSFKAAFLLLAEQI